MNLGPIQFLAIGFERVDLFTGAIRRELGNLRQHGLIRLIDSLFVMKDAGGNLTRMEASDMSLDEKAAVGAVLGSLIGFGAAGAEGVAAGAAAGSTALIDQVAGLSVQDVRQLIQELPPGKAVALLLVEHTWATDLKAAIRDAGGHPLMQGYLTPEAMLMIGREAEAIADAQRAIEASEAVAGAAMIDAMVATAAAEDMKAEVAREVAASASARARSAIAAQTLRTLIDGAVISKSAAGWAFQVLVKGGLIDAESLQAAKKAG